jgi:excisionase family DNA binding protein
VAEYLHLTRADVEQRVKNREIPFIRRGRRLVFHKQTIEEWASRRILDFQSERLAAYHGKSTRHTRRILPNEVLLPEMLAAGAVACTMASRTQPSVLGDLVALAEKTGNVCNSKELLAGLKAREELCSTGLPGGFALPHPRFHEPSRFEKSFIVVGRTVQEIYFGAHDGEPTQLFFLVCCRDERLHLHTLARLCLMAKKTDLVCQLLDAPAAETMRDALLAAEREVLPANHR